MLGELGVLAVQPGFSLPLSLPPMLREESAAAVHCTADANRKETMPTSPILELRVAITTADYERLVTFYEKGLGLNPADLWTNEHGNAVIYNMGRATLEVFDESHAASVDEIEAGKRTSGHVRFALQVPDLEAALKSALAWGATQVHEPITTPWGHYNVRIQSPDGLQITLFQATDTKEAVAQDAQQQQALRGDMGKEELEKRILEARYKLKMSESDLSWIANPEFIAYLDAWTDLYDYYMRHDGETKYLYFEIVASYLELTRFLNILLRNPKHSAKTDMIEEALAGLEYTMDGLTQEGYRQINNPK
jgi:methylmalonyl-CoA/ethylmalonyl-CoA epimerase